MISDETRKKIEQVASVCIRCRRCMKECLMLNRFAENPKVLFTQYLEKGPENMDRHIAYSCNECSQCTLKCPKGLNLKAVFQSLKEDYASENQGIVPVEALLPSELGQTKECAPEYCTALTASAHGSPSAAPRYLFIPGKFPPKPILQHLQMSLGEGNVTALSRRILDEVSPELLEEIGNHPARVLISACPSSFQLLKQALPNRKILFYWDLMHDLIGMPQEEIRQDAQLLLADARELSDSVRWVLDKMGCQWTEEIQQPGLLSADRDCRQILGLMFGVQNGNPAENAAT